MKDMYIMDKIFFIYSEIFFLSILLFAIIEEIRLRK